MTKFAMIASTHAEPVKEFVATYKFIKDNELRYRLVVFYKEYGLVYHTPLSICKKVNYG